MAAAGRQIVRARCARSGARGVRVGMTIAEARALLPPGAARVIESDPSRESAALRGLAVWALRYCPLVAPDGDDGLIMDISGCAHLFGGERALAKRARAEVQALGFASRAAVAPTLACAWGVARCGASELTIVPDGCARGALEPLPLGALGVGADAQAALREVGVTRIGELLRLPRAALPARFGPDLLLRLDRALGHAIETLEPVRAPRALRAQRGFEGPTTDQASIHAAAREALEDLCAQLSRRERGAGALRVEIARPGLPVALVELVLSRPSRSLRHLWTLLQPRLERTHLGLGVEGVSIAAIADAPLRHRQDERWRRDDRACELDARQEGELIDTLVARLGARAVWRVHAVETHIPERAFRWRPALMPLRRHDDGAVIAHDRPSLLLARPEPAEVTLLAPDGPLLRLRWRGRSLRLLASAGPERIEPEWWRDGAARTLPRDYFKAQDEDGRWLWLLRGADGGAWSVHGLWA